MTAFSITDAKLANAASERAATLLIVQDALMNGGAIIQGPRRALPRFLRHAAGETHDARRLPRSWA